MNIRALAESEARSLTALNEIGIPSALIFLTATGLEKSILDATEPVRNFLKRHRVHDYEIQKQGVTNKVELQALLLEAETVHEIKISLYRPRSKHGDPRLWPSRLPYFASGGDVIALIFMNGKLGFINLTRIDVSSAVKRQTVMSRHLDLLRAATRSVSDELLSRLREIASQGPLRSIGVGDTTIGMTIERALGIAPNSKRAPDYRGIEIKAARAKASTDSKTRATLFACVPDWHLSRFKSSAEILKQFGYDRGDNFKLYCTVSAVRPNSQGLILKVDDAVQLLREMHYSSGYLDVVVWRLDRLEGQLAAKHRETFWIKARVERVLNQEWFHFLSVSHTQNPNLSHLSRLLADGGVTVDHLIKRVASGGAREKGPLFKIARPRIEELFLGSTMTYFFE